MVGKARRIVVCADDFGMNRAVDAGILALGVAGRVSATSCLVDGPACEADISALLDTPLQIGLHLNFTERLGQPDLCLALPRLILASYARRLAPADLRQAIERQLDRFEALTGRAPHYIDGHQHVHQLPQIRDALLAVLARRYTRQRPWLRYTGRARIAGLPWRLQAKARIIAGLGSTALRRQAMAQGIQMNPGFMGVYDFQGGAPAYLRWMGVWLAQCQDGDVLMCHPAQGLDPAEALAAQRQAEFSVLGGPALADLLNRQQIVIQGA
ncbi:ChbG/HpnK family deacetylase [Alcaligenaceae bacterium CGII-47]|nr:ChbG/HpnK family deacetylase [Alcaligenaceae bacterium CGII-47]